ncbi:MAG: hypothetical protein WC641_04225 [Patescibacteria group bacterium]
MTETQKTSSIDEELFLETIQELAVDSELIEAVRKFLNGDYSTPIVRNPDTGLQVPDCTDQTTQIERVARHYITKCFQLP